MTPIKCPECRKEVSDTAKICTNCGYNIKKYVKKIQKNEKISVTESSEENTNENRKNNHRFIGITIALALVTVLIFIAYGSEKKKDEEEYQYNLAAQVCSVYNYTNAVIELIESSSSLEWYLDHTDKTQDEALKTYGSACHSALKENRGLSEVELEPVKYTGNNENIKQAYEQYVQMYNEYNEFCELIVNPYVPPKYIYK